MYTDTSIQIRPSDAQLRQLPQRRIWMSRVGIFSVRSCEALSTGTLELALKSCVPRFSGAHPHIFVAVNLAQRIKLGFSCYELALKPCSRIHCRLRLLFYINRCVFAGEVAQLQLGALQLCLDRVEALLDEHAFTVR